MAQRVPTPWSRALVIGLGVSGRAAARLLRWAGVETVGYDQRADLDALPEGMIVHRGLPEPPDAAFEGIDLLVLSPGVPPAPHLERAQRLAPTAAVHGELSLSLAWIRAAWPRLPTVLVTGTNGKSTVTALGGHLLAAGGRDPFVGGNLGTPAASLVWAVESGARPRPGSLVLECSSYQLETLAGHPTDVAMLLNVAPDHLGRYADLATYARVKARVFSGLGPGGLALLDATDPWTPIVRPEGAFTTITIDGAVSPRVDEGSLRLRDDEAFDRGLLRLAGRHNARNALFALLAARHLGVAHDVCARALPEFAGLPHRMQRVGERDGVTFYDDSKATNVAAVLASLDGFPRPFVLVAGGRAKGEDLSGLRPLLRAHARGLVALGEAADAFVALAHDLVPTQRATDMHDAVHRAISLARPGDAIVLSPACASFDMYESFAHRGRDFARVVAELGRG